MQHEMGAMPGSSPAEVRYSCPMHPDVVEDKPGSCKKCGMSLQVERQFRGKPAGIRTSILICLSTAIFIHLGASSQGEGADPTRVLGQLVSGVGFLGAGVMMSRNGVVTGVTTAAVIWILAKIGAVIGFGYLNGALTLSLVTVIILVGIEMLESSVRWLARGVHGVGRRESEQEPPPS